MHSREQTFDFQRTKPTKNVGQHLMDIRFDMEASSNLKTQIQNWVPSLSMVVTVYFDEWHRLSFEKETGLNT
jgi:hypothetical protein